MKQPKVIFGVFGAMLTIIFLVSINQIVNPSDHWSIYPSLVIIFWPIIIYHLAMKKYKALSLVSSLSLVFFLGAINYVTSSSHPWFLYAAYPILWWPILMYAGRWCKKLSFAVVSSGSLIAYYIFLNLVLAPGYPWAIYTTFLFLWWPIIHYVVKSKRYMTFSAMGTALITIFFILVNYLSTPKVIWAIYPVFVALWWPLITYCFSYMKHKNDTMNTSNA